MKKVTETIMFNFIEFSNNQITKTLEIGLIIGKS